MNKLLDELSQKAEDYADDTDLPWLATYTQKLAELIVKECVRAVEDVPGRVTRDYDWLVKQTKIAAIEKIKEKFGVQ